MTDCPKCGSNTLFWMPDAAHKCPPQFEVWSTEDGKANKRTFYACDAEDAATLWAEREDSDSDDYRIASGRDYPTCCVQQVGSDDVTQWSVRGEYDPSYYAQQIP